MKRAQCLSSMTIFVNDVSFSDVMTFLLSGKVIPRILGIRFDAKERAMTRLLPEKIIIKA